MVLFTRFTVAFVVSLFISTQLPSQDSLWQRHYEIGAYNQYDLRTSSTNFIGAFRVINDVFDTLVTSKMSPTAGSITKGIFNFGTIYLSMVWSHEFGHYIRAKQVGGKFNFHNFGLPIPETTADLPADINLVDEAIFITGGFEVNTINTRKIQNEFLRQNGTWNEDLSFSFANRLMYPIYTTLIVRVDAEDPEVWIETAGDPIHYILPVWENYSDGKVFLNDGSVNPKLASFYDEATILAQIMPLIDPQFYREIGAAFGKSSKSRRPIFLIGDFDKGWTYSTLFNASPLGYELYLQNYLHLEDHQFGVYFKYGRPFKNLGVGLSMNDAFRTQNFRSDVILEAWNQDLYGSGVSLELSNKWKISKWFGLHFIIGYKTEGYVLGKQLNEGFNLGGGVYFTRMDN